MTPRDRETANEPAALRVFWDGYGLDRPSGVAAYGQNLALGLAALGITPEVLVPTAPFLPRLLNSKPLWPRRVARMVDGRVGKGGVLHGLSNFNVARPPRRPGNAVRTVLTVHDLIPFLCPAGVSTASLLQLKALLPRALAAADRVICVSEWTRATVAERYPWAAGKLIVIRHGLAAAPAPAPAASAGGPLVLFYQARGETYKQISIYLDILTNMGEKARGILLTDARGRAEAQRTHALLVANKRLEIHVGVADAAYQALFSRADVYLHTSRLEGYCLPAADALRHGVPVVYQAGSATGELLSAGVGTPLAPKAAISDWEGAVYEAFARKGTEGYLKAREDRLRELPTWDETARAHAAIYSGV